MSTIFLDPSNIFVGHRLRALDPVAVEELKKSISKIGLRTPISVRRIEDEDEPWGLVTGRHRLQACIELRFEKIEAREEEGDERDARLWEIAENLHRAELSTVERDEHLAEWIRLTEEKEKNGQPAQFAPAVLADGRKSGPQHQQSGINAAARALGVERTAAQRAVKRVESIPAEVRAEIKDTAIANSGVQLDALAKAKDTPELQLAAVKAVKAGEAKDVREVLQREQKRTSPHSQPQSEPRPSPTTLKPPTTNQPNQNQVIRPDANLDIWRFVLARITDPSDVSELSGMVARTYSEVTTKAFARALAEKIPPEQIKRLSSNDPNYFWMSNGPTKVLH